MLNSNEEFLSFFGWDDFFEDHSLGDLVVPARVICEERNLYRVQTDFDTVFWASVRGKMQFNASGRADYPAVGDWVLLELPEQSDRGIIHRVLPRKTIIHRKQVGSSADMQILSTNVDYIFITTSVNEDLNYRRIERYLAMAWESGCVPVILLSKADVCTRAVTDIISEVEQTFPGVSVLALSVNDFAEAEFLPRFLRRGTTSVFVGSSGVGKSTLVNFLIGDERIKTQEVREDDGKGRHTTTSRNLYVSRYGGLVIDTPGMRELQLSDHVDGVSAQFSDIEDLMVKCRFSDCRHEAEPGCAVLEALARGALSEPRWLSYKKLEAEVRHGLRKMDKALAAEDRRKWKKLNIEARARSRGKRGGPW